MYTDEEQNAATINYLKNFAADRKEPLCLIKGNKRRANQSLPALRVGIRGMGG
jgi:hypothetical protein